MVSKLEFEFMGNNRKVLSTIAHPPPWPPPNATGDQNVLWENCNSLFAIKGNWSLNRYLESTQAMMTERSMALIFTKR